MPHPADTGEYWHTPVEQHTHSSTGRPIYKCAVGTAAGTWLATWQPHSLPCCPPSQPWTIGAQPWPPIEVGPAGEPLPQRLQCGCGHIRRAQVLLIPLPEPPTQD